MCRLLRKSVLVSFCAALTIGAAGPVGAAPRDDRRACWQNYSICSDGAQGVESWRTVCYSDYTACMRQPEPMQCGEADMSYCSTARSRCESRLGGREGVAHQCGDDHQVCLDAHAC